MAQKRYFDFQSKIRSKTSAEAMALASAGIGVKYGFNKVSASGNTFVLSSNGTITLTNNETGDLDEVKHVVITPDGIISAETEDISLVPNSQSITDGKYYFVIASHQHIESLEAVIATSYNIIEDTTNSANSLISDNKPITDWYQKLRESYPELNTSYTVIVALIAYTNSSTISVYTPYNNVWPTDFVKLNKEIEDLNTSLTQKINGINTSLTQKINDNYNTLNTDVSSKQDQILLYTGSFKQSEGGNFSVQLGDLPEGTVLICSIHGDPDDVSSPFGSTAMSVVMTNSRGIKEANGYFGYNLDSNGDRAFFVYSNSNESFYIQTSLIQGPRYIVTLLVIKNIKQNK